MFRGPSPLSLELTFIIMRMHLLAQRCALKCSVVALHREAWVLQLKVATSGEIIVDLLEHGAVVLEASNYCTGMHVVEGLTECPLVLGIVDFEATVRRDARSRFRGTDAGCGG
jgi:hypothetical protein